MPEENHTDFGQYLKNFLESHEIILMDHTTLKNNRKKNGFAIKIKFSYKESNQVNKLMSEMGGRAIDKQEEEILFKFPNHSNRQKYFTPKIEYNDFRNFLYKTRNSLEDIYQRSSKRRKF